ncbi:lasso RiPP family leader peptide-containing protein [Natronobiforma cellulositropha]|nr:lasso RiPP family leader peptide-containing protein [Natronobiforma cellulositropha]
MTTMGNYESPVLEVLGDVEAVTHGNHFSAVDGNSGTTGNRGRGNRGR